MNIFTKVATTALIGATVAFGAVPAEAKVGVCQAGWPGERLEKFECDVDRRVNANGHVVFDLGEPNGKPAFTIVLWEDMSAEVIFEGKVQDAVTEHMGGGYYRIISHARGNFNIIFPTR